MTDIFPRVPDVEPTPEPEEEAPETQPKQPDPEPQQPVDEGPSEQPEPPEVEPAPPPGDIEQQPQTPDVEPAPGAAAVVGIAVHDNNLFVALEDGRLMGMSLVDNEDPEWFSLSVPGTPASDEDAESYTAWKRKWAAKIPGFRRGFGPRRKT